MVRLDNPRRVFRLIDAAIERVQLDLSGLQILTEAASGAYVVTALIAARAGAERVHAVTRDSRHGRAAEVIEYGRDWADAFGVGGRIRFVDGPARHHAAGSHIVTNLGFVRPIDRTLVDRLPAHAVVCLMWEPWEFRPADIDLAACLAAGIPVVGTNERDERLRTFDFVGVLAIKLLLDVKVEICRSRIVVIGSDPFGGAVERMLAVLGADVRRFVAGPSCADLDRELGGLVDVADAVVLAEHRDARELVGLRAGVRPERFRSSGCQIVHVAGVVDDDAIERAGVMKHPPVRVKAGYMAAATDLMGPRPVIDLHAAGLQVGALAARCRLRGGSVADAIAAAEASGLGVRVDPAAAAVH